MYEEAIAIWEAHFGDDNPQLATALNNLALLLLDKVKLKFGFAKITG